MAKAHRRLMTTDEGEKRVGLQAVGATALLTAAARARESRRPNSLFVDPYASALAGSEGFSLLARQDAVIPGGPAPIFAVRTRAFDDFLLEACVKGARQVVLVAAGLDTRAYRLPWPAGVRIFELDQAAVLEHKRSVLEAIAADPSCDLRPVATDLRKPWADPLLAAGYDPAAGSVWLVEGLVLYLDETQVQRLLAEIHTLSSPGDQLGIDFVSKALISSPTRREWLRFYEQIDAPLRFATDDGVGLLSTQGFDGEILDYREEARRLECPWPAEAETGPRNYAVTGRRRHP
jgi:methyltransferase (TIGR00027 family)